MATKKAAETKSTRREEDDERKARHEAAIAEARAKNPHARTIRELSQLDAQAVADSGLEYREVPNE